MKQARRKELKSNELMQYLQDLRDAVVRYSNYIVGGLVVVVLILMIGLYVQHNRHETEAARWREYLELQPAVATGETDVIDRAASLADATAGDPRLGPQVQELYARALYARAMTLSPLTESGQRAELLDQAKANYQKLLDRYPGRAGLAARTRLSLADVEETLFLADKGELETVRELYGAVVESGVAPYVEMARTQLDSLDDRTRKLEIVATRPADEPEPQAEAPVTAPANAAANPVATPTTGPADRAAAPATSPAASAQ